MSARQWYGSRTCSRARSSRRLSRARSLARSAGRFGQVGVVAFGFQLLGQLGAALGDEASAREDVNVIGADVVEDALVVGDDQGAHVGLGSRKGKTWIYN